MFVPLSDLADVSLGYKSLQNDFFYVDEETVKKFGIEKHYLEPIAMLGSLSAAAYIQQPRPALWLFHCKSSEADLRGTGALRYIESMADRPAKAKKQSKGTATIRQTLQKQGGGRWYAPKAQPHLHHIWLRKGVGGVFSPFLFRDAALVDQRCNSVAPKAGTTWEELAAVLTTTLFAYSLEVNGSSAMGAGALEVATTKLRDYPVFDVRKLNPADRARLVTMASTVWAETRPVDWMAGKPPTGGPLWGLDSWLLRASGSDVAVERLYNDLSDVCGARQKLANDKVTKTKSKRSADIGNVAENIADRVRLRLHARNFPEGFLEEGSADTPISITPELVRKISIQPFLGDAELTIEDAKGNPLLSHTYRTPIAEAIARAVLWGRSSFSVSSDPAAMNRAIDKHLVWLEGIRAEIDKAIENSALGTGYEDALRRAVYVALRINENALNKILGHSISL